MKNHKLSPTYQSQACFIFDPNYFDHRALISSIIEAGNYIYIRGLMSNLFTRSLLMLFKKLIFILEYLFKNSLNEKKLYLEKINKEKVIVFDIGSNLGNYSKFVSKIFSNKEIYIHSFEPIKNLLKKQKINTGTLIKNNVAVSKNPELNFMKEQYPHSHHCMKIQI